MGEFIDVGVREGYRLWASSYDQDPNPLLALEARIAAPLLGPLEGARVIDLCTGTGRWMAIAAQMRANVTGLDLSPEMLARAGSKAVLAGRLVFGDLLQLPFADRSADLVICSFAISYVKSIHQAFREMARVGRKVMVSDMHPDAAEAGWIRSFKAASQTYRIRHRCWTVAEIGSAADAAGLRPEFDIAGQLGEPERALFVSSGHLNQFEEACKVRAIFVKTWSK